MSLHLEMFFIPKCPLRSYLDYEEDIEQEHLLLPSDLASRTDTVCSLFSREDELFIRCDMYEYQCPVKRVRVGQKNILEVSGVTSDVNIIRGLFQVAREAGCDYIRMPVSNSVNISWL